MIAVEAAEIGKAYVPGRWVFRYVTLRLSAGEALAVVGPNGSGKTTLLKVLCGLAEPTEGRVWAMLRGQQYAPREVLSWAVGVVAPFLQLYTEFTPWELVGLSLRLRGMQWDQKETAALMERLGLQGVAQQRIGTLSTGMQQRVRVALAVAHKPLVFVLDEVAAVLDPAGREAVAELVAQHRQQGGIVLVATNADYERSWCERVIELPSGRELCGG
ncbi:MAG: ABC transporter ATP-binding protein [Candidatus Kapabacteria bacterium]|nr:ABC transporter ATP-binding protein [Candidatus Kapabacteria bacterium]MDW8012888.1 ABC transporter ATP-binding protein [Bacteroidota bacterium]